MRFSKLSDNARTELREIVSEEDSSSPSAIDDFIFRIDSACFDAFSSEDWGDPTKIRAEITRVLRLTDKLIDRTGQLSLRARQTIENAGPEELEVNDSDIRTYFGSGVSGEGLYDLRMRLSVFRKLSTYALEEVRVSRGSPVEQEARLLAIELRMTLEDRQIKPTTYDSGIYMRILQVVFSDLLPTEQSGSYRRHGSWALSVSDPDNDIDWHTMRDEPAK